MLSAFYVADGVITRTSQDITVDVARGAIWIDLLTAVPDEVTLVQQAISLRIWEREEIGEIESSSRLSEEGDALYINIPMVSLSQGINRGAVVGCILTPRQLITTRFAPSSLFDLYAAKLPVLAGEKATGAHVLVGLLEAIVDRQADALERLRDQADLISERIFIMGTQRADGRKLEDATLRRTLGELGHIADVASHIRDTQMAVSRGVPFVQARTRAWMPKLLAARLKVLRQDIGSIAEYDAQLMGKLQFLLDATLGFVTMAQNNVMKVMAIASVVGIPPVAIAGIYGMNFKHMPELEWEWGYAFGLAAIVVSALIPTLIFRLKKWI
jgi:magnesium transporter